MWYYIDVEKLHIATYREENQLQKGGKHDRKDRNDG